MAKGRTAKARAKSKRSLSRRSAGSGGGCDAFKKAYCYDPHSKSNRPVSCSRRGAKHYTRDSVRCRGKRGKFVKMVACGKNRCGYWWPSK